MLLSPSQAILNTHHFPSQAARYGNRPISACLAMASFTEADDAMAPAPNQSSPAWRPPCSQQPDASYFCHTLLPNQ